MTIGEHVRNLRAGRDPRMSQRELAAEAGVSTDIVRKLEQGTRQTASLATLHRIAAALDVDVSELLARPPARIDTADQEDSGTLALRHAVTRHSVESEPAEIGRLQKAAQHSWASFWSNRFDELGATVPAFLDTARATARATDDPRAYAVLSDAYGVAGSVLVHVGYGDLALLAMERAANAAEKSDDPLRAAAVVGWIADVLQRQTGSAGEAQHMALAQAQRFEPVMDKASPAHLSVWGSLMVGAAIAAARAGKGSEADDLLETARDAADQLGGAVQAHYERAFGLPVITMQLVDSAVVTGRAGRALTVAKTMPPDAPISTVLRARHLADVAYAYTDLRKDAEATDTLWTIQRTAPRWMKTQPFPRVIVQELRERERRVRTPRLRELASILGV